MIRMPGKKNEMMVHEGTMTIKVVEQIQDFADDDRIFTVELMKGTELPADSGFMVEAVTGKTLREEPHMEFDIRRLDANTSALMTIRS